MSCSEDREDRDTDAEDDLIEQLVASEGDVRALIIRRRDGHLTVVGERYFRGDSAHEEPAMWVEMRGDVVIVDSLERAREIAKLVIVAEGRSVAPIPATA